MQLPTVAFLGTNKDVNKLPKNISEFTELTIKTFNREYDSFPFLGVPLNESTIVNIFFGRIFYFKFSQLILIFFVCVPILNCYKQCCGSVANNRLKSRTIYKKNRPKALEYHIKNNKILFLIEKSIIFSFPLI